MELESSYQQLGVLRDDGIRTYSAVEIASGQAPKTASRNRQNAIVTTLVRMTASHMGAGICARACIVARSSWTGARNRRPGT